MSLYQKNLGKTGEDLALDFLKSHSYSVLEKTFVLNSEKLILLPKKITVYILLKSKPDQI